MKKFLLFACALIFAFSANSQTLMIGGEEVASGTYGPGGLSCLKSGNVRWYKSIKTLTLINAVIEYDGSVDFEGESGEGMPGILLISSDEQITVELAGENKITDTGSDAKKRSNGCMMSTKGFKFVHVENYEKASLEATAPIGIIASNDAVLSFDNVDVTINATKHTGFHSGVIANTGHKIEVLNGSRLVVRTGYEKVAIPVNFGLTLGSDVTLKAPAYASIGTYNSHSNILLNEESQPVKGLVVIGPKCSGMGYYVYFKDWDGIVLSQQGVCHGDDAVAPADPVRTGFTFMGWDKEFSNVTKALTINAVYDEGSALNEVSLSEERLLENPAVRVFNVLGADVTAHKDNLPQGAYILRVGNKVQKISIK